MEYVSGNFVIFTYTKENGEETNRQGQIVDVYADRIRVRHYDHQNNSAYYRMYNTSKMSHVDTWNPDKLMVVS